MGPSGFDSVSPSSSSALKKLLDESLFPAAGPLWDKPSATENRNGKSRRTAVGDLAFIPQVVEDPGQQPRVLVLCTGGTMTMMPDADGSLSPVQGALSDHISRHQDSFQTIMPDIVLHEYTPFFDSSDLGPADWARVATDIATNYLHFDGFVVVTGTDTMAYFATALSFMLENLGKPVVFTGSQIPLCEPHTDAHRNLMLALIFASRVQHSITEVTICFHDRLLRACRSTKVNTHSLRAFDSPNQSPLATIGIGITDHDYLWLPPVKGALRVHPRFERRLLTLRMVPGFDDHVLEGLLETRGDSLQALVLQMYGTGNLPSAKKRLLGLLEEATNQGILVVAATQCHTGSVQLGHYSVGKALTKVGVVSALDMTLEATACKIGYLVGRGDLQREEVAHLMEVSLRGELTPMSEQSLPPSATAYQKGQTRVSLNRAKPTRKHF